MKVKVKINSLKKAENLNLLNEDISYQFRFDPNYEFLEINNIHEVYGLLIANTGIWIFIFEDLDDDYPKHYPLSFFEIIDQNIPSLWTSVNYENFEGNSRKVLTFLADPIWNSTDFFYEKLVDGDTGLIEKFKEIKK